MSEQRLTRPATMWDDDCLSAADLSFLDKGFLVVMGKGGVGRSTVSLALGRLASKRGRRTLVCLSNAPPRYGAALGGVVLGPDILEVGPDFHVVNMEPVACQEEYGMQVLGNRLLHGLIFGNRVVRSFMDAVPGLAEWAMLGKATYHALDGTPSDDRFDTVIFDAPATGHGLDLLALPRTIVSAVPSGRMRKEARMRIDLLENPHSCEILPVTIPEEIPVQETREAVATLRRLRLPVGRIIVNMVRSGGGLGAPALEALEMELGSPVPHWLRPAAWRRWVHEAQQGSLRRLDEELGFPKLCLPLLSQSIGAEHFLAKLTENWERP